MIHKHIPGSNRLPPCTPKDMVTMTLQRWDEEKGNRDVFDADDCEVRISEKDGEPCLVVEHLPTGRTSEEFGDHGRWDLDGLWFAVRDTKKQ